MPRRPILLALALALATTVAVVWLVGSRSGCDGIHVADGCKAPPIAGTDLDGSQFDLASLAGRPVLINFWGPSCVPCR